MSDDEVQLPNWMPSDAHHISTVLFAVIRDSGNPMPEARDMLQRLTTRLEMKDAWRELRHFPNCDASSLVMMTLIIWLCAHQNRVLAKAPHLADSSWRTFAIEARALANRMRAVDATDEGITDTTLVELDRVAAYFGRNAEAWDALQKIARPPRKARSRNALEIAFLNTLCASLWRPTARRPYKLVATLTNVAFDVHPENLWDADKVKKCYASRKK